MIKKIIFGLGWACCFFSGLKANATTTLAGVTGASNVDVSTPTNPQIFGGVVVNAITCNKDGSNTCNTCDGVCGVNTMCPCNQTAIYPSLRMNAGFNSTIDLGGRVILYQKSTDSSPTAFSPITTIGTGVQSFTISQLWSFWCSQAGLTTACSSGALDGATLSVVVGPSKVGSTTVFEDAEKITLQIQISVVDRNTATPYFSSCPNGSGSTVVGGICYYKIARGDEKVFLDIDPDQRSTDYPSAASSASGLNYSSMLYFYKQTSNPTTIRNNSDAADLAVDTSGTDISFDDRITGLSNDIKYCFILGNMDKAGNVRTFQDPTAAGLATQVCATPSAVQGLLDDKKCFIATAAFGSNMDPHVDLLRRFRAQFLMPTAWGTSFVKFYYNHSSIWAQKIRQSERARMIVRGFLWPVIGFAALSLDFGMPLALTLVFFGLSLLSLLIIFRKKIKEKVLTKGSFFILFSFFSFCFFLPSAAKAQDSDAAEMAAPANEDFEEGSAPNEPPYVDSATGDKVNDEFNDEFEAKSTAPTVDNKDSAQKIEEDRRSDSQALPLKNSQNKFSSAPDSTVTGSFKVPKSPQTTEGRELGHEKIYHPMSQKGLLSIEKDGSYYYEPIKFESKNESISVRVGGIQPPPNILGPDGRTNFSAMYGGSPVEVNVDYEWYPFVGWGKLGVQGGGGFFTSTGSGRFTYASNSNSLCNPAVESCEAREKYNFYGIPLSLGVIYRLQVSDRPYLAPYAVGGGSYYALIEKRDDGKPFKAVGSSAFYGGGGVMVNISAFDRSTAFTLESEYGLHNVWISADYRYIASLSKVLDVSASLISLGVVMDY